MKKLFKSISVLVLSLSLALSGFVFTGNVKAEMTTAEWEASAVKTPTEGSLVGAGYIDVEFDNSLPGYTYEVFLDGNQIFWKDGNILRTALGEDESEGSPKTFTSSDTPKTEVYTTEVAEHTITVKATKPNATKLESSRTFYVSKKGMAMGDNMGSKVSLQKLNCSWYYNWGTKAFNNSIDNGVSHIPMMWGGSDENKEEINNLNTNANYILGFNEPDIPSQANLAFWEGVDVWNQYISPLNMRKASPVIASNNRWLKSFMDGDVICQNHEGKWDYYSKYDDDPTIVPVTITGVGSDVDAICVHYYKNATNRQGLVSLVNSVWKEYGKPIWLTEIGLFGKKGTETDMSYELDDKRNEIKEYVRGFTSDLDSIPFVERYCWFSYDVESDNAIDGFDGSGATSMFEYSTGLYTELGKLYSQLANPQGYSANTISDAETFDWNNRVRTDINYDSYADKVKVSWSKGSLDNLSKVDVKIDDEPYSVNSGEYIDVSGLAEGKHYVEFTLYENDTEILKISRGFKIDRSAVPTTVAPTVKPTKATTKANSTVKPVVKPGKSTLKAKNIKKKSAKLSWSAVSGAKQYRLQWALNKKFTKSKKTKTVTKLTYKVTKLKKKKTYFFRVAAMNSAGIGPWSNVKKLKIKK